ncbi:MAG: LysE family transporter [Candidatus Kerfeldbacteria bacterium]|nr:LysE family transporter [Candidatus Kerfeldbacteria bacterium]
MLLLSAFIIGFTAAALPGAVQTTVLQTAITGKWKQGLRFSAGAAFMDGFLLLLAFAGIIQFIVSIFWIKMSIGILGVGYMLILGITGLLKSIGKMDQKETVINKQTFWNGALLVILHPPTILYFIGVAATLFATTNLSWSVVGLASFFLFLGAFVCFLIVAICGWGIHKLNNTFLLTLFRIITSLILIFFALKLLYSLIIQ